MDPWGEVARPYEGAGEVLLDLGDFQTSRSVDEDFVLDIDLDETPEASPEPAFASASVYSRQRFSGGPGVPSAASTITADLPAVSSDQLTATQDFHYELPETGDAVKGSYGAATFPEVQVTDAPAAESDPGTVVAMPASAASATEFSPQQLSPEMIDAIALRVVEHMSEKVVQEIAWEVVPQLAELLIKRQLEEKNS